jgi:hypothetical protein
MSTALNNRVLPFTTSSAAGRLTDAYAANKRTLCFALLALRLGVDLGTDLRCGRSHLSLV